MEFREKEMFTLKYVKAGQAGKVLTLSSRDISNKLFDEKSAAIINKYYTGISGRDVFIVIGESMAQEFIHTEDILLVKKCKKDELTKNDFIILEVDGTMPGFFSRMINGNSTFGYKLRKFLDVVDLNNSKEDLFKELCQLDIETQFSDSAQKIFFDKYEKAKKRIKKDFWNDVLLSITYTDTGKDYSFHESKDLCDRVEVVLSKDASGTYAIKKTYVEVCEEPQCESL